MRSWLKTSLIILSTIVILFTIGGYVMFKMLQTSLPEYEGEIQSIKIKEEVKIYHDSMAVAYILAQNDEDAALALGFVHAQERMFIMDLIRRAGEGRLSEILGEETVPFDIMFRTIGIERTAEMIEKKMEPEALKLLQAYSEGVNLYIDEARNKYTFEFDILNYQPEYWKPLHSIIIIRMMAWELNMSWWSDLTFTTLAQKLSEEKVKEILPDYPENAPMIIPNDLKKIADINNSFIETDKAFRKYIGMNGTHIGSNNWVVNSQKSKSGKPIIANDPHLAYSAPGKWFAAVIKSPNWNAAGVTLPGVPGIVIGKNESAEGGISWALTNIMSDDTDFYFETFDSSRTKYLVDDKWHDLKIIKDTISVKGTEGVPFEIKLTHRGPIISSIHPYTIIYNKEERNYPPISMRWLGNDYSDELSAFIGINKAKNWGEFKSAVQKFNVPGQNFIYADDKGNIGYVFGGALPLRENNNPTFLFDGSSSNNDWRGSINKNELPFLFNPVSNFIATANNKVKRDFKYHISNFWEPSSRIERITELLSAEEKHSAEDFMGYQMDLISPYVKQIVPYIINAFDGIKITDNNLNSSLDLLAEWNFEIHKFSQTPSIYLTFFDKLMNNIYRDEMGDDLYNQYVFLANIPYRNILELLEKPNSIWFNDVNTKPLETRDDIIRKSLADALTELESKYGKNIADWQWGKMHKVTFKHPFSGNAEFIDMMVDIGPYEIGGDGTTIFNTEYSFAESIEQFSLFKHKKFENELGPSMRFIFDFAKPDEFYLILNTGQSGNVLSEHYNDMTDLWLQGKYMKIRTDENSIMNNKNSLLKILRE